MIDVEAKKITLIKNSFTTAEKFCPVYSTIPNKQPQMPCAYVYVKDSYPTTWNSSRQDVRETVTINARVYSNKENGRKQEAKELAEIIDNALRHDGWIRTLYQPMEYTDINDSLVYSIMAEYVAEVDTDGCIYSRR